MPQWRKYILEIGVGIDLHGQDVTKAAQRAVKDAISHVSMIGLREILPITQIEDLDDLLLVDVTIATPFPQQVDHAAVLSILPEGRRRITVVEGGILYPTPHNNDLPAIHPVVTAVATIVVLFDIEKSKVTP
ncbi:MAG: Lin0512 family protein [Candidatus Bathyarchaeota archaeon]|nr:Lin0512 family protein [Candidatus Bathyarchaeota archaeon]